MRELILSAIIYPLAAFGVVNPLIGLYAYIWFAMMRPDALAWAYGDNSYSLVLAMGLLLGSVRFLPKAFSTHRNIIILGLVGYEVMVAVSVLFAVNRELAMQPWLSHLKMITIVLVVPMLVTSKDRLRGLILVAGVSLGLLGAKFGLWGILHGGARFVQGHAGFMTENNTLALGLAMGIPLCWFGRHLVRQPWLKTALLGIVFMNVAAVVMCHSRGAAVALGVGIAWMVRHSKWKAVTASVFVLLALPGVLLVQESFFQRMGTLSDPMAEASAASRVRLGLGAIKVWTDYPVTGVGYGRHNWIAVSNNYVDNEKGLVVHNTYLQTLVDSGILTLIVFCGLLFGTMIWLEFMIRRFRKERSDLAPMAGALQVSLLIFAVQGLAGSREHFDLLYFLLAGAACLYNVRNESTVTAPQVESQPVGTRRLSALSPALGIRSRLGKGPGIRARAAQEYPARR